MKEKFSRNLITKNGRSTQFIVDEVKLESGALAIRDFLVHPGAVCVLAKYNDEFIFVKQYRYPVKRVTIEIPAGKLEKNENIVLCAKRELKEETGYITKKIRHLISYYPTGAFSTEIIHIFYTDSLIKSNANPDDDEDLTVFHLTGKKVLEMIKKGKIKDSKTIIAFLYYFSIIAKEK